MQLLLKIRTRTLVYDTIDDAITALAIKQYVADLEGIPIKYQRLTYASRILCDTQSLVSQGVTTDSTIHVGVFATQEERQYASTRVEISCSTDPPTWESTWHATLPTRLIRFKLGYSLRDMFHVTASTPVDGTIKSVSDPHTNNTTWTFLPKGGVMPLKPWGSLSVWLDLDKLEPFVPGVENSRQHAYAHVPGSRPIHLTLMMHAPHLPTDTLRQPIVLQRNTPCDMTELIALIHSNAAYPSIVTSVCDSNNKRVDRSYLSRLDNIHASLDEPFVCYVDLKPSVISVDAAPVFNMPPEDDSFMVCPVCFEEFDIEVDRRPRTLSCGHSLCTECLNRIITTSKHACPQCREPFDPQVAAAVGVSHALMTTISAQARTSCRIGVSLPQVAGSSKLRAHASVTWSLPDDHIVTPPTFFVRLYGHGQDDTRLLLYPHKFMHVCYGAARIAGEYTLEDATTLSFTPSLTAFRTLARCGANLFHVYIVNTQIKVDAPAHTSFYLPRRHALTVNLCPKLSKERSPSPLCHPMTLEELQTSPQTVVLPRHIRDDHMLAALRQLICSVYALSRPQELRQLTAHGIADVTNATLALVQESTLTVVVDLRA
jgi:hypothetical protein